MPTERSLTIRRRHTKLVAEVRSGGAVEFTQKFDRLDPRDQRRVAAAFGWDVPRLLTACDELMRGPAEAEASWTPDAPDAAPPFTVSVRPKLAAGEAGVPFPGDTPRAALLAAFLRRPEYPDALAEWPGRARLCCLDIDYHRREPPNPKWLGDRVYTSVHPRPFAWHVSHGGGLHCYYEEAGGFSAEELAAVAALCWLRTDASATIDLTAVTRHPLSPRSDHASAGPVHESRANLDLAALARLLGDVSGDEDAIDEWLADAGWRRGGKYPHDFCPIDPCPSHGEPVYVGDAGVFCHRCHAGGRTLGGRRPGFVPWAALVGRGIDPTVAKVAKNLCHWEHARVILLDRLRLPEATARLCYSALLKMLHGADDARLPAVFSVGRDMIRLAGRWASADGTTPWRDNAPTLRRLPACQWLDGQTPRPDETLVNRFQQPLDLAEYGYPAVSVIRGCRIYGHWLGYSAADAATIVSPSAVVAAAGPQFAPRYRDPDARMPEAEYRALFERSLPGLNWGYLKLLIAAKGSTEERVGLPPMLLVDGPSGSAKSATVTLAAAVCGDVATEVVFSPDTGRFRQAIQSAAEKGTFLAVNEILKDARRARLSATQALDPLLNLTEDSESHKLYVGPVPLGRLPVVVLTDVHIPDEVRADTQLGRRLTHVRQTSRVDWEPTLLKTDVRDLRRFRVHSTEHAAACDALLSDVIDEFFGVPRPFGEVARSLGFSSLESSAEYDDPDDMMRQFFQAVCDAPEPRGAYARNWPPAAGWKMINRTDETPLAELWLMLCDDDGKTFTDSRRCRERDWGRVLGVPHPVAFDVSKKQETTVAVRFRCGPRKAPTAVNGGCINAS